jgi:NADP-dependent 3-hydroxy acid dehydrogenase YdfG
MPSQQQPVALVTGASSGMGKDFALRLLKEGYAVYGAARRTERMADLASAGCSVMALDVTDDASMIAAVGQIIREKR